MTSLFQARRRAEEFATAVDDSSGNSSARGGDVVELLEVVAALRAHEPVAPRADFAADLRERLMAEAETALDPVSAQLLLPARERGKRERRMVAAASAFVLIGGTTTMAAASQSALPGEALYPIKRGIERAEAGLSLSDAGKGHDLLRQAESRLAEVGSLVTEGDADDVAQVPTTLTAFTGSAEEGSRLLFASFRDTSEPEDIVSVRTFAAEGIATLNDLARDVPDEAQSELTAAAILLSDLDAEAAGLCGTCAPDLPVVEVPGLLLARAEVDRALSLAATRDLVNNHPVEVPRGVVERIRVRDTAPTEEQAETGSGTGTSPGASGDDGAPQPAPLPTPTLDPESWPSLLPGLGSGSTGTKKSDDDPVKKVTEDLESGLGDAVETILPEAGSLLD